MTEKKRKRRHVLHMVVRTRLTLGEAAVRMGVSYRHAKRLKRALQVSTGVGLAHSERNP